MANDIYTRELRKALAISPAAATTMSRPELEAAIAGITSELRGHLSNVERLCLVEDRQRLRKQLASLAETNG